MGRGCPGGRLCEHMRLAIGASLLCCFVSISGPSDADSLAAIGSDLEGLSGFNPSSARREREIERILRMAPSAESVSRHLLYLTEEPHQTGTPRNMELADELRIAAAATWLR